MEHAQHVIEKMLLFKYMVSWTTWEMLLLLMTLSKQYSRRMQLRVRHGTVNARRETTCIIFSVLQSIALKCWCSYWKDGLNLVKVYRNRPESADLTAPPAVRTFMSCLNKITLNTQIMSPNWCPTVCLLSAEIYQRLCSCMCACSRSCPHPPPLTC